MLKTANPYSNSNSTQIKSNNNLNYNLYYPIDFLNKQRNKRSDNSGEGEQLIRNAKLHQALRKKNLSEEERIESIKKLLETGANINFQDPDKDKNAPLHIAVQKGYSKVIKFLLQNEADVTLKNNNQQTPKDLAAEKPEILRAILEKSSPRSDLVTPNQVKQSVSGSLSHQPSVNQEEPLSNQHSKMAVVTQNLSSSKESMRLLKLISDGKDEETIKFEIQEILEKNGIYINYHDINTKQSAIDIAWEKEYYSVMIMLLEKDSNFPVDFKLDYLSEDNILKSFVKERENLHELIEKDDNLEKVIDFVSKHHELKFLNRKNQSVLETAAEKASSDMLEALLRISKKAGPYELNPEQKKLLTQNNQEENSLLLKAIENKKHGVDIVNFLIRYGVDVKRQQNAINLAWKKGRYDCVLQFLEADSPFPDGFSLDKLGDSKDAIALKKLTKERENFHQALKDNNLKKVEQFSAENYQLKQAYSPENLSALTQALKNKKFNIYAFLQSRGYAVGEEEQHSEEELTESQKQELKHAKAKYFAKPEQSHIIYLLSKSRLGVGQKGSNRFDKIKKLYEALDDIPEISTILKVVEHAKSLDIIFDFNHNSIIDIDPTQSAATTGAYDYRQGRIYIGAKQDDETELRGTLAHELTHLAMQIRYHNDCNPYEALDEHKKSEFQKIVEEYQSKRDVDEVIKRVFTVYKNPNEWPSELIVRVPHLLAKYGEETGKDKLKLKLKQASSLHTWYKEKMLSDLENFIINPEGYKTRHQIQDLNQQLEQLDKLRERSKSIQLIDDRLPEDKVLDGDKITLLSSGSPQLTLLLLYQKLAKSRSPSQLIQSVLVAQASQFKNYQIAQNIFSAMQSPASPFLIIDCTEISNNEERDAVLSTLNGIKLRNKIVLVVPTATSVQEWKKFSPNSIDDSVYRWKDLTQESQKNILKNEVKFQGNEVSLNELMDINSPAAEALPLEYLLSSKTPLEIGKPVPTSHGYDKALYIDRTLNQQITIKEEIFDDLKSNKFTDSIAKSQQEFEQHRQGNPNVHWLQEKSGQWLWKQSKGSLALLRDYIDNSAPPKPYHPQELDQLLKQEQHQEVMLISDTAGMGKTTVLTHLSKKIKEQNLSCWVVRIDLNDYTDILKLWQEENKNFTPESAIEFIADELLKIKKEGLDKPLFNHLLNEKKVVLMLDGFDEISPNYKDIVLSLIESIKQTSVTQLWVTTRPHLKEELENKLGQFSYTLEPFSEENQVKFMSDFWSKLLKKPKNERIENYARELVKKLETSIKDKKFTGIPLQTYMLAEAFDKEFKEYYDSGKPEHNLPSKLNLLELYDKFLDRKYLIYVSEKNNPSMVSIATEELISILKGGVNLRKTYQHLAIKMLLPQREKELLENKKSRDIPNEKLSRIGIANKNGKIDFIHRTFAEYFVADFVAELLNKQNSNEIIDFILKDIFLLDDYQVIRVFIDEFFKKHPINKSIELYGNHIDDLWNNKRKESLIHKDNGKNFLHVSCEENNNEIFKLLFNSLKKNHIKSLKAMLSTKSHKVIGKDSIGKMTVLHVAADKGNLDVIKWITDNFDDKKSLINLLREKSRNEDNILHIAAKNREIDIIKLVVQCFNKHDKSVALGEVPRNNKFGNSFLDTLIEYRGELDDIFKKVVEFLEQENKNILEKLITNKNHLLDKLVSSRNLSMFKWFLEYLNKPDKLNKKMKNEILEELLYYKNHFSETPLQWAISLWPLVSENTAIALLGYMKNINNLDRRQVDFLRKHIKKINNDETKNKLISILDSYDESQYESDSDNNALSEFISETHDIQLQIMNVNKNEPGPSCRRRRRDLGVCGGEMEQGSFPYEPWQGVVSEDGYHAQLHAQLALSLAWGHPELAKQWMRYQRYLGEIVEEGLENQSPRERGLLHDHYQQALEFFAENPKSGLFQGVDDDFSPAVGESVFLQNGLHSWLVFNTGERYQLYSPDFNYRQRFQTRVGVSWGELSGFMRAFFNWKSGSGEYHSLVLTSPLPGQALLQLQKAPFWQPEAVVPDRVLLERAGLLEGVPLAAIRELIRLQGQVVDEQALHGEFLRTPGIQLNVDRLHQVLPTLTEAQQQALVSLVQRYHWPLDKGLLDRVSAEEQALLTEYQQQVLQAFQAGKQVTPEQLSELSWKTLGRAIEQQPELPAELKSGVIDQLQTLHSAASRRAWVKGMATQTLFFLPDMIRAANTGQVDGLVRLSGMLVTDGGVNHLYGKLLERLAPTLSETRLAILQKLPVTSPVFKALTIYSVVELTQQLQQLPANSEQRQIIQHRLGEQYATLGLMVVELLGSETGPLWIGLMAEQLIFDAIAFRKEHHLDIPFWEAFIMSLGFEQAKLQDIVEERQLVDINLAQVERLNAHATPPYGWVLVKVPPLGPPVWQEIDSSQVPHELRQQIVNQPEPLSSIFRTASVTREAAGFRQVEQYTGGRSFATAGHMPVSSRGQYFNTTWYQCTYQAHRASHRLQFLPTLTAHYQEDNIFQETLTLAGTNSSYSRWSSVAGQAYRYEATSSPLQITGAGLAALYRSNNSQALDAQQHFYLGFDPREGDVTLQIYPAGLQSLALANTTVHLTLQVGTKGYPSSIIFSQPDGGLLSLQDYSQQINSHYLIGETAQPFRIRDNARATRVAFMTEYQLYSDGPEIIRLQKPGETTFQTVWLKAPKQYLQLRLTQQRIAGVLLLAAEQLDILSAQGEDASQSVIHLTSQVHRFAISVAGNLQITQNDSHLFVIGTANPEVLYSKTPGSPYQLTLAELEPLADSLRQPNPREFHFDISAVRYAWTPGKATLQIIGLYQGQPAQLLLENSQATLSQAGQPLALFHYTPDITLDHRLRLQRVIPTSQGYRLQFQSASGAQQFHQVAQDTFSSQGIHYQIRDNRLMALGADHQVIDGQQLIHYRPARGVDIYINQTFNASELSRDSQSLQINALTLRHLPKQTRIYFKQQSFPWQALQETTHRHRHHHHRNRRQLPDISSAAQRPSAWITSLWQGLRGILADPHPRLAQATYVPVPDSPEYTSGHLQGGLQLLDLVIRQRSGKKYSPPALTLDFDTDDKRRTTAAELAYAAHCPVVSKLKQSLATEIHEPPATTAQEPWLAYPLPTTDANPLMQQLT